MATVPTHPIGIGRRGLALTDRSAALFALALILLAPAEAHASLLSEEAEDKLATFIAIAVLLVVPVVLIVLFWMVHILPEKIAHKRHHPQFEAIRTLCRSRGARSEIRGAGDPVMEIILLGIYSFFVWLIFIKLKLLPWTTPWKVAVAIFPVVMLAIVMLLLNIFAPATTDVRVVKYIVPIVSQVRGRVIEVPVENNRPVKKGDVLFRIDPTPYQNEVHSLEARLVSEEAKVAAERARVSEVQARLTDAQSSERQLHEQLNAATGQVTSVSASLELARTRVAQNTELVAAGAGNRFDLE